MLGGSCLHVLLRRATCARSLDLLESLGCTMNPIELVKKYLRERLKLNPDQTGFPFVTISRESCAGGHTLAREIIRQVEQSTTEEWGRGWEVFDYRLCLLLAQDPELNVPLESLLHEEYQSSFQQALFDILTGQNEQHKVQKRIFEVIRILAMIGRVVIVGRAGNLVTRDLRSGVHLRLVAPASLRVKQMMELMDADEAGARSEMEKQDRERAQMVRDYFNRDITNPLDYDCTWNTGGVKIPFVAATTARMMVEKARQRRSA
ncbi:MAG: cytidylate kinase-like family protein [Verrucomicrobia bacterium]|nr:MAG: cytidylate kinase-like family protein [Verrucomicrobiota bacterium]